jgi:formylglycine-generating enzyme
MKTAPALVAFIVAAGLLGAGTEDAVQKDRKQMTGSWRTVAHEKDGKKLPDDQSARIKTMLDADGKLTVQEAGKTVAQANLKIDPARKPKQVDLAFTEGEWKGKTLPGIYDLAGDSLKLCYTTGKDRPADFASRAGNVVIAYQRELPPKLYASSTGIKFVWIAPGSFAMGSSEKEEGRNKDEFQHKVTLTKGFFVALHTVTQEQWQAVMGSNPSQFKGDKNLPVENVSWDDCQEFCKKMQTKDKKRYRLPTEAEWEFACRAGTTTPFHYGETMTTDQANFNGDEVYAKSKKGTYRAHTTPVGSFPPNAWGLFDMHGNVWQWCQDRYGEYPAKDVTDPQGASTGNARVVRGGARFNSPAMCRAAQRHWYLPGYRGSYIGCRLCFTE